MRTSIAVITLVGLLYIPAISSMVTDDAVWRRGMITFDAIGKAPDGGRIKTDREGKLIAVEEAKADGGEEGADEKKKATLASGELRFEVDPDYGFIEYRLSDEKVSLFGGAIAEHDQNTITADVIRYRVDDKVVWAEGRVLLTDPEQSVFGQRMSYDLGTKQGLVYYGDSEASIGFYTGEKIKWASEDVLYVQNGTFTTCSREEPDYHFWSPRMKVILEDQVVARPAVMHIGRVPVAALPYYYMSLRRDRHSGFLSPYARYVAGQYFTVNNGYFWAINDFCDLTTRLNYYSKTGWQQQANYVYLYGSDTSINSLNADHLLDRSNDNEWWSVNWYHRQDLSKRTTLLGQLNLRSNSSYDRTFGEDFETRSTNSLNSFAVLTHRLESLSFTAEARRNVSLTQNYETTDPDAATTTSSTSTLPRLSVSSTTQQIADSGFYYSLRSDFTNYYSTDFELDKEFNVYRRASASTSVSRPFRFLGWLNYSPQTSFSEQWDAWDEDYYEYRNSPSVRKMMEGDPDYQATAGHSNIFTEQLTLTNSLSTKIYGMFPLPEERLIRHIVSPNVTHVYSPQLNPEYDLEGSSSSFRGSNYLNFSLGNSLDLRLPDSVSKKKDSSEKLGSGTTTTKRVTYYGGTRIELIEVSSSINYDFQPHTTEPAPSTVISSADPEDPIEVRNWSYLTNTLRISPTFADWYSLSSQLSLQNDVYTWERESLSINTSLGFFAAALSKEDDDEALDDKEKLEDDEKMKQLRGGRYGSDGKDTLDRDSGRYDPGNVRNRLHRMKAGDGMGEGFVLRLDHEYAPGSTRYYDIHTLRGEIGFNLSHGWRIRYDNYFDLVRIPDVVDGPKVFEGKKPHVISEHYRIYRDLHCWEAEVRVSTEREQVEYWFQIRIKELPEFQLFGTREREF